ncbi:MAG TPA: C39 family peptidase [Gemmatimonadales bacterium]|nr:C39 family peptidase [Gemmatimonadales bacterium]
MSTLLKSSRTIVLPVPYFSQPTSDTCQSTCLKMMATYLEQSVVLQSTGGGERDILEIWKDVNQSPQRPVMARNAHANMKWWLERHFPTIRFEYLTLTDEGRALEKIVAFIAGGVPVLMSVSHARVPGHIILVVGYENYVPSASTPDFDLVVHDPYGRFDPSLLSKSYGRMRWLGGMSLVNGGETGPGQSCRLKITSVGRQRRGDARRGTYYLLSAKH